MTQDPNEFSKVEQPFFEQLKTMGWDYVEGDVDVPYNTVVDGESVRESFRDTLLIERLKTALQKLNPWMGDQQMTQALHAITHLTGSKLMERNQAAMELLVKGVPVDVDPDQHGIKTKTARIFDFDEASNNDFLAINQFRVDILGSRSFCIPDLVLFANGIPLVVVECKNPSASNPVEAAITDLLKYSNQRDNDEQEGVERLFDFNLFMVATTFYEARSGTIGARPKHYMEWKDTSPVPMSEVAEKLQEKLPEILDYPPQEGTEEAQSKKLTRLSSQQMLIAGMLHPDRLLDLLHNFVLFADDAGRTVKILARYQQYRAVHEAIHRLQTRQTREQHGEVDQRGGIIWHTQGSGKSLTMVFLIRKMRTIDYFRPFKIVVVTDRRSLERQLSETAELTGEPITKVKKTRQLQGVLSQDGPGLVFAMIQKYQVKDTDEESDAIDDDKVVSDEDVELGLCNASERILVLVDEAHRSHGNSLHGNLIRALPNCAKIGFTGTPIMQANKLKTETIFGGFIDVYTIKQSQDDGATRPIRYEGWSVDGDIKDDKTIDEIFEATFVDLSDEQREAIKQKYVSKSKVRDATNLINEHAAHIFRDYLQNVLPNGLKAQMVASSRRAAIRYQNALEVLLGELLDKLDGISSDFADANDDEMQEFSEEDQFLVRAKRMQPILETLQFAAVVSGHKEDPDTYKMWTSGSAQDTHVARFKKPLTHKEAEKKDGLCILSVKSMLLTGFDAPINQTLYIDRFLQGHELLQAIARVNRNYGIKRVGRVVDFFGVAWHLGEALRVYSADDRGEIAKGLTSIRDELTKLDERHKKVLSVFVTRDIPDIKDADACVALLRSEKIRAEFVMVLKAFLSIFDSLRFRPEVQKYVADAKQLGFIHKSAANLYRVNQLEIADCGEHVRNLIDEHLIARGIDPEIEPVDILHADFEQEVERQNSDRAKAAAMEHAAKAHCSKKMDEDPVLYQEFSERINRILEEFAENWAEQKAAFLEVIADLGSAEEQEFAGLAPGTQVPFFRTLMKYAGADSKSKDDAVVKKYAGMTVEILDHIRQEIRAAGFWQHPNRREVLRSWVEVYLYENDALEDTDKVPALADHLIDQAKSKHTELVG